jgi:hypothetical protein
MTIEEFIAYLKKDFEEHVPIFVANLNETDLRPRSYCQWISLFVRWMEWGSVDDCENLHDLNRGRP